MDYCGNMNCDMALYSLLKTLDGRYLPTGGCDMIQLVYSSGEIDPDVGTRTKGDKQVVLTRTAYVVGVINIGIIV